MALITCPECGKQISNEAEACPSCGYPVKDHPRRVEAARAAAASDAPGSMDDREVLLEVRRSWWNFTWHFIFFWLVIPLFVAFYRHHSFLMRIHPDRISIEEGFWSKEVTELFISDIRSIDVKQGFWGRIFDVGQITVSTAATVDPAEIARGVPHPQKIKDLLIARRQQHSA